MVRYEINTGPRHLGKFGTTSIPVPDASVIRYDLNTGSRHLGKFGTPTQNTPGTGIPYRTYPWHFVFYDTAVDVS